MSLEANRKSLNFLHLLLGTAVFICGTCLLCGGIISLIICGMVFLLLLLNERIYKLSVKGIEILNSFVAA